MMQVQEDIVHSLHLNHPAMLMTSFNRPNISYQVELLDLMQPAAAVGVGGGLGVEEEEEGGAGAALREKAGE
jgi:superfamily II DNA helicase RecQ